MKKVSILLMILLFCATSLFAQKLSFQAVVRNSANELVPNATLTVAVSVLDASNTVQYSENHTGVQTNQNGLLSLMVGDGTPTNGTTMADVVWNGASIRTVITLPDGATITNTTPVNAVPYALSAGNVDPTVVADAIADYLANYITAADIPEQVNADWNATSGAAQILNKPTIPTVPANVSEFNNDANYVNNSLCDTVEFCTLVSQLNQLSDLVKAQKTRMDSLQHVVDSLLNKPVADSKSCPGIPTVTDYDGNVYNTVLIGEQCWIRENLKTTKYADGTPIPAYTGSYQDKFYYNTSNTNTFGLLYNWKAAMNTSSSSVTGTVQGICPTGWHIPSTNDYSTLTSFVNTTYPCNTSGENALAATSDWLYSSVTCSSGYNLANNNASGFSALPAGGYNVISNTSGYTGQNTHAYFWCSDTDSYSNKKAKNLQYDGSSNFGGNNFASSMSMTACSVRCLRD